MIVEPKEGLILRVPEEIASEEIETIIHNKSQGSLKKLEAIHEIQSEQMEEGAILLNFGGITAVLRYKQQM